MERRHCARKKQALMTISIRRRPRFSSITALGLLLSAGTLFWLSPNAGSQQPEPKAAVAVGKREVAKPEKPDKQLKAID